MPKSRLRKNRKVKINSPKKRVVQLDPDMLMYFLYLKAKQEDVWTLPSGLQMFDSRDIEKCQDMERKGVKFSELELAHYEHFLVNLAKAGMKLDDLFEQ